jgi:hypothetical protein
MLGALTTLKNLLAKEQALLTLDTLTYVGLITDGRPEGRPWWDNRPEYGQGWTGVNVPLPGDPMDSAPDLAGVPIISSGLRNTSAGTPIKMPTAASSNPGNVSVCRGPGRWRQLKLECFLLRPVQQPDLPVQRHLEVPDLHAKPSTFTLRFPAAAPAPT